MSLANSESSNLILVFAFADYAINSLPLPTYPTIHANLMLSNSFIGNLNSLQSLCALLAGFITVPVMNLIGPYSLLLASTLAQMLGYILVLISYSRKSSTWFLIGRLMPAIGKCSTVVLKALLVDIAMKENGSISESVGKLDGAMSLGFVFSPILGGYLSSWLFDTAPLVVGAFCCILNILLLWYMVKRNRNNMDKSHSPTQQQTNRPINSNATPFSILSLFTSFSILHVKGAFWLTNSIYETFFGQILKTGPLQLSSLHIGLLLGYVGLVSVLVSAFLIPKLSRSGYYLKLLPLLTILMGCGMFAWSTASNLLMCIISSTLVSTVSALFGNVVQTIIATEHAATTSSSSNVSNALALSATVDRAARIVAPFIGGYFYNDNFGGPQGLGICACLCCLCCLILQLQLSFNDKKVKK